MEQQQLELFHVERLQMPEHPWVILRWDRDCVRSQWPDFPDTHGAKFRDWQHALEIVLHPVNHHIRVRVRV